MCYTIPEVPHRMPPIPHDHLPLPEPRVPPAHAFVFSHVPLNDAAEHERLDEVREYLVWVGYAPGFWRTCYPDGRIRDINYRAPKSVDRSLAPLIILLPYYVVAGLLLHFLPDYLR